MGEPDVHITYEDLKRAADANSQSVEELLATVAETAKRDAATHPGEY